MTKQPFAFHSFLQRDAERVTRGQLPQHYKNVHRTFSCRTVRPSNLARKSSACSVSSIVAIHTEVHLQTMIIWSTSVLDFLRLHASIHFLAIMVFCHSRYGFTRNYQSCCDTCPTLHIPVKALFLPQFAQHLLCNVNPWRHGRQSSRRKGWNHTILLWLQGYPYFVRMVSRYERTGVPKDVQKKIMQSLCQGEVRARRDSKAGQTCTTCVCERPFASAC